MQITQFIYIYLMGVFLTLMSTLYGYYIFHRFEGSPFLIVKNSYLWILIFITTIWLMVFANMKDLTILSHHSYYDFSVFLEYFKNFSQGKGLISSMQENSIPGNGHWFSNHFTPLAYIFAIAYKITPSVHTITWLQTLFMATSPVILYLMSRRFIGEFGAFCLALALILNPTFQYITLYEFEFLRFIIPMGIFAIGVTLGRYSVLTVFLSSVAVLLIREDAAFFVFGLGLFIFFFQKGRRLLGVALIIISCVYLVVILKFIMPLFRGLEGHVHVAMGSFQTFGNTPSDVLKNIASNPLTFIAHLLHPFKVFNLVMFVLPFSFVPLAGRSILVIMLPTLFFLSFSSADVHMSYFFYYVAPVLPVMVWSTVIGIPLLVKIAENKKQNIKWLRSHAPSVKRISFAIAIGSLVCSIYFGPSPISVQFWFKQFKLAPFRTNTFYLARYQPSAHDEVMGKVATLIPKNTSVSAEQVLLQHVFKCGSIYVFPNIEKAEYIFIDKKNPRKAYISSNPQYYYDLVEKHPEIFRLVFSEDGVYLYKRKAVNSNYLHNNSQ